MYRGICFVTSHMISQYKHIGDSIKFVVSRRHNYQSRVGLERVVKRLNPSRTTRQTP